MFDTTIDLSFEGFRKRAWTRRLVALFEGAWSWRPNGDSCIRAEILEADNLRDLAVKWMARRDEHYRTFYPAASPSVVEAAEISRNSITGNQVGGGECWEVVVRLAGNRFTGFRCYVAAPSVISGLRGRYFNTDDEDVVAMWEARDAANLCPAL